MDQNDFIKALETLKAGRVRAGIGTLGEKSVHALLKLAYEPHTDNQEVPVGGYVADIVGENGIIEIQTRELWKLKEKLTAFLEVCDVTVVHPLYAKEWVIRTDPKTGEATRRRSPRKGRAIDILPALYDLRGFLQNPRFHMRAVLLETERYDVGVKRGRKVHIDRVPTAFVEEIILDAPEDFKALVDGEFPLFFTANEFGEITRMPVREARMALSVLCEMGTAFRKGKRGRLNLYSFRNEPCNE